MPAELNTHRQLRPGNLPGISVLQPVIGNLLLPAVSNGLVKDAVFIADAVTNGRNLERCQGVHEAGCQASQAAVAESGFLFLVDDVLYIELEFFHGSLGFCCNAQIKQIIGKLRPKQILGGKVADHANILLPVSRNRVYPTLEKPVANRRSNRQVIIQLRRQTRIFALLVDEIVDKGAFQRFNSESRSGMFMLLGRDGRGSSSHGDF